jgi:hypothetical protein
VTLPQVDTCGPVYISVGDGGNIEGLNKEFIDKEGQPWWCDKPKDRNLAKNQMCFNWQNDRYCPEKQPEWSAYREPSFGHGLLDIHNATHAHWMWVKGHEQEAGVVDEAWIMRNQGC